MGVHEILYHIYIAEEAGVELLRQSVSGFYITNFDSDVGQQTHAFRKHQVVTPYNVGSVLWRLFSTLEVVQYIGGITSVLWGDSFSTVEGIQYIGGITSVHAGG